MKTCGAILLILLLVVTGSRRANGADPSSPEVVKKAVESLNGPDPGCASCQVFPNDANDASCDDLFEASCRNPDGTSKFKEKYKALNKDLWGKVREARNAGARAMGAADLESLVRKRLKDSGLELVKDPDPKALKILLNRGAADGGLFSGPQACSAESDRIRNEISSLSYDPDVAKSSSVLHDVESVRYRFLNETINAYAMDVANFVANGIEEKCRDLKERAKWYPAASNGDIVRACAELPQIRKEAIELFRKQDDPEYQEKSRAFVMKNILPSLKSSDSDNPGNTEIQKLWSKINNLSSDLSDLCNTYQQVASTTGEAVVKDLLTQVNQTKATVDSLIDGAYTESRHRQIDQAFTEIKSGLSTWVQKNVPDAENRKKIIQGYENLPTYWLTKPDPSFYKKNDEGVWFLDGDKAPSSILSNQAFDSLYYILNDPDLSFFTMLNSDYMLPMQVGNSKNAERVRIDPAVMQLMDKNPDTFYTVLAHEAGHKVGPQVSWVAGYDSRAVYQNLLACYREPKSILLQPNQEEEAIADFLSSEMLAVHFEKLPKSERREAWKRSVEVFCLFDEQEISTSTMYNTSDHPASPLRTAGIFGANPNLRQVMGCTKASSKYKSCGLKGAVQ